jgi:hypothetical protein
MHPNVRIYRWDFQPQIEGHVARQLLQVRRHALSRRGEVWPSTSTVQSAFASQGGHAVGVVRQLEQDGFHWLWVKKKDKQKETPKINTRKYIY